jgi:muramoyltetrapeptide carboxypeptidase
MEIKFTKRQFVSGLAKGVLASGSIISSQSLANSYSSSSKNNYQKAIRPRKVRLGSTIGLVATATTLDREQISWAVENIESLGFKVKLGSNAHKRFGYLAGTDQQRANDLNDMFKDKNVDAIWCLKGGWGSARILDLIDYETIKKNPKPFIGYSDVTSLLNAINHKTGLITFHGPNALYGDSVYTEKHFLDMLLDQNPPVLYPHEDAKPKTLTPGVARGKILGGNLTVLTSIIGSKYEPNLDGAILFLEDVSEPAYKVDRMLTQLKLTGALDKINGVVFGTCSKCVGSEESFTVEQVIAMHFEPLKVPVFVGASIGHILHKMTVPVGAEVTIDATRHTIEFDQPIYS